MTRKEAIVKSVVLLGLTIGTAVLCQVFPNAANNPQTGMVMKLPEEMPGHTVHRIEPGEKELYWLPKDTGIMKRAYQPLDATKNEDVLFATLILSGNDPRSLHRPEVCLVGQGWRIKSKEVVTLKAGGQDLKVMDFTLARADRDENKNLIHTKAHYVYWWIGSERSTPHDWERIVTTRLDNIFRNVNNRWGYPSVMVYVDPDRVQDGGHEEAQKRAYDWIEAYAPVFQKSLGATEEE